MVAREDAVHELAVDRPPVRARYSASRFLRSASVGLPSPVQTSASSASRCTRSGCRCANSPARNAPDDAPYRRSASRPPASACTRRPPRGRRRRTQHRRSPAAICPSVRSLRNRRTRCRSPGARTSPSSRPRACPGSAGRTPASTTPTSRARTGSCRGACLAARRGSRRRLRHRKSLTCGCLLDGPACRPPLCSSAPVLPRARRDAAARRRRAGCTRRALDVDRDASRPASATSRPRAYAMASELRMPARARIFSLPSARSRTRGWCARRRVFRRAPCTARAGRPRAPRAAAA